MCFRLAFVCDLCYSLLITWQRSPSLPMILFTYLVLSASALLFAIIERPKVHCALSTSYQYWSAVHNPHRSLWHARVKVNRVLAVHSRYQLFLNGGLRALSLYLIFCSLRCVCVCVCVHVRTCVFICIPSYMCMPLRVRVRAWFRAHVCAVTFACSHLVGLFRTRVCFCPLI